MKPSALINSPLISFFRLVKTTLNWLFDGRTTNSIRDTLYRSPPWSFCTWPLAWTWQADPQELQTVLLTLCTITFWLQSTWTRGFFFLLKKASVISYSPGASTTIEGPFHKKFSGQVLTLYKSHFTKSFTPWEISDCPVFQMYLATQFSPQSASFTEFYCFLSTWLSFWIF